MLHALKISIALISLSLLITAFYLFSGSSDITHRDYNTFFQTAVKGQKGVFVDNFLADENEIDGPFNNRTLADLCWTRHWTPGLIFKCEAPEGGIANVRNVVLNCVRYAIEAGATGFIVPEILLRTAPSPSGVAVPFTHFFDLRHFSATLQSTCPQIHIFAHRDDLFDLPSTAVAISVVPTSITPSLPDGFILGDPGNWAAAFHSFLNITHPAPPTAAKPVLVSLGAPLLQFPLTYDDPHLVAQFGRILRFREDVRRVAAATLYALNTKYDLGLQPGRDAGIPPGKFYGAHLRTGVDAMAAGWVSYALQERNYIDHALKSKLSLIYLTPTTPSDMEAFTHTATHASLTVETKNTLLGSTTPSQSSSIHRAAEGFEEEWKSLQGLSWDQQLLVDYEVLLRSSIFGGMWESSFSWNVAMRRHVIVSGAKGWTSIAQSAAIPDTLPLKTRRWTKGVKIRVPQVDPGPVPRVADVPEAKSYRPVSAGPPPAEHPKFSAEHPATLSATEKDLVNRVAAALEAAGPPTTAKSTEAKEGDASFEDRLSTVFGPVGEGSRVRGSLWP